MEILWTGGWTRWATELPFNQNCSLSLWRFSPSQPCLKPIHRWHKLLRKKGNKQNQELFICGFIFQCWSTEARTNQQVFGSVEKKQWLGWEKRNRKPWWRLFRSQNSPRELQERNCLKISSQAWNGSGSETADAANDGVLIYALCISSAVFPVVFQLSNSKVTKLTAL